MHVFKQKRPLYHGSQTTNSYRILYGTTLETTLTTTLTTISEDMYQGAGHAKPSGQTVQLPKLNI